jgi:hypothetical protein
MLADITFENILYDIEHDDSMLFGVEHLLLVC